MIDPLVADPGTWARVWYSKSTSSLYDETLMLVRRLRVRGRCYWVNYVLRAGWREVGQGENAE